MRALRQRVDNLEITGDNLADSPGEQPEITGDNPEKKENSAGDALEITRDNQKLTRLDIANREGVNKKTVETWATRGRLEAKGYVSIGYKGQASLYRYDPDKDTRR